MPRDDNFVFSSCFRQVFGDVDLASSGVLRRFSRGHFTLLQEDTSFVFSVTRLFILPGGAE